jgi:hypothetical protein
MPRVARAKQKFPEAISFLLGLHPRCGANSAVSLIGPYIARDIVQNVDDVYCVQLKPCGTCEKFVPQVWRDMTYSARRYFNCHEYVYPVKALRRCVLAGVPVRCHWNRRDVVWIKGTKRTPWTLNIWDGPPFGYAQGRLTICMWVPGKWDRIQRPYAFPSPGTISWHPWETDLARQATAWLEMIEEPLLHCKDMMAVLREVIGRTDLHSSEQRPRKKLPAYWFMIALHEDILDLAKNRT